MDKTKEGQDQGEVMGMAGVGGSSGGGKWRQLYLNNNFKNVKKKRIEHFSG